MLIYDLTYLIYKIGYVFFEDYPSIIEGYDNLLFYHCNDVNYQKGFSKYEHLTSIINLKPDLDTLWKNLDSKTRQKIRNASNLGIKIKINQNYEEFYDLYYRFRKKKGFGSPISTLPSKKFIEKSGFFLTSEIDNKMLGGAQYFHNDDKVISWIMTSKRLESDKENSKKCNQANNLLVWEAIKYSKNIGISEWDRGGLWSEKQIKKDRSKMNSNQFKLSFGGEVSMKYNYHKRSVYYKVSSDIFNMIRSLEHRD